MLMYRVAFLLCCSACVLGASIVDVAKKNGLTTLLDLVVKAGLADDLTNGASALTVLAPTNKAFSDLPKSVLEIVTKSYNKDVLAKILLYHVFGAQYNSKSFLSWTPGATAKTLQGSTISLSKSGSSIVLNGDGRLVTVDVPFSNGDKPGVVHVISKVLVPPNLAIPTKTITDLVVELSSKGSFTELLKALQLFGSTFTRLLDSYTQQGFTVFAPTDAAFKALPPRFQKSPLVFCVKAKLGRILKYHVVPGYYPASALKDGQLLKTVNGNKLEVSRNGGTGGVFVDDVKIVQADIRAGNGIIHVIDEVLLP